jgi:hypothetical protein
MYFDFVVKNSTSPIDFVVNNSTSPIDFVGKNLTLPIDFVGKNLTSPIDFVVKNSMILLSREQLAVILCNIAGCNRLNPSSNRELKWCFWLKAFTTTFALPG